jgi:hypothetical protein
MGLDSLNQWGRNPIDLDGKYSLLVLVGWRGEEAQGTAEESAGAGHFVQTHLPAFALRMYMRACVPIVGHSACHALGAGERTRARAFMSPVSHRA